VAAKISGDLIGTGAVDAERRVEKIGKTPSNGLT
jgi:hypothetical protein